ncbi:cobalt transporter, partial [Pseudomonas syringae]|nr:cobalt transporter [Pseudomonas syringae]
FMIASLLTNALFWIAMGLISAWLFRRSDAHRHTAH